MQDFTERGKRVFQRAHKEALRLGHEFIGTEHFLLALLYENDPVVTKILSEYGVSADSIIEEIEKRSAGGAARSDAPDLPVSERAKLVLDLAMREAGFLGMNYVGVEHIFLALLIEGESFSARLLASMGLDVEGCRKIVATARGGYYGQYRFRPPRRQPEFVSNARSFSARTPTVEQLASDLTKMAKRKELDPVVGRAKEIRRVVQILARRKKNNPVLIGEPGVGKTAVIEGLAQRIASGEIPEVLRGKRVMQLNVSNLVAGTKYRGEFEERMERLVKELREAKNIILFIDEIHMLVGAGGGDGTVDAANILKPSLTRGEFQVIGATTIKEYRKYIEKDAALERRFQQVLVDEPTVEEAVLILKGLRSRYEEHHRVVITDAAVEAAASLSKRYVADRFLPDKAIDLIDEASARARIDVLEPPEDIKALDRTVGDIRREKESAAASQEFEKAAYLRDEERKAAEQSEKCREEWIASRNRITPEIRAEHIAAIVSESTGVPVSQLTEEESRRLLRMEEELKRRVIGQDDALRAVSHAVRRARSGMKDPKRPVGSFLFLGPTGVGKTEVARSLAEFLFGSEDAMIRFDMSEFMERHEAAKLIGAPPGYVGYDEGGKLTESIRRKPYSVVLFDEIEKAHPDVFNILLQLLEDGRLTDGHGRVGDFRNSVVIMTSNVGVPDGIGARALGFGVSDERDNADKQKLKDGALEAAKKVFRPEFLNRIDEISVFEPLGRPELVKIIDIMLSDVRRRAADKQIDLEVSEEAKSLLLDAGYDPKYGARPLRRTIQKMVEDEISNKLLEAEVTAGGKIYVDKDGGGLNFKTLVEQK